jgi:hypothetical protein
LSFWKNYLYRKHVDEACLLQTNPFFLDKDLIVHSISFILFKNILAETLPFEWSLDQLHQALNAPVSLPLTQLSQI